MGAVLLAGLGAACAGLVVSSPAASPERVIASLLLALALPGVAVGRFVPIGPVGPISTAVLAVGTSVAVLVLDSVLLYAFGVDLDNRTWAWSLAAVTGVCAVVGAIGGSVSDRRNDDAGRGERGRSPCTTLYTRRWTERALVAVAIVATAGALVASVKITGRSVADRTRSDRFTQLWALPGGATHQEVRLGLYNHEARIVRYRLRVTDDRGLLKSMSIRLASGRRWTELIAGLPLNERLSFSVTGSGRRPVRRQVQLQL